jgi:hypothetical protein
MKNYEFIKNQVQELAKDNFVLFPDLYDGINALKITESALHMCNTIALGYFDMRNETDFVLKNEITVEDYKEWCRTEYHSFIIDRIEEKISLLSEMDSDVYEYDELKELFQEDEAEECDTVELDNVTFGANWETPDDIDEESYISFIEVLGVKNGKAIFSDTYSGTFGNMYDSNEFDLVQAAGGSIAEYAQLKGANYAVYFGDEAHFYKR